MAKAKKKKKSKTIKSKAKSAVKKVKKAAKRAVAKVRKIPAKVKKAVKKAAPKKKKKQIVGEGDYAASRKFLKDQSDFVKRNKAKIPAMGKAAKDALDGPEGDSLRAAEAAATNPAVIL